MPRKLGTNGPQVSDVGFGCMGLNFASGAGIAKQDAIVLIREAFHSGVTFFDTTEAYGPFTNEEWVGEALATLRDKVVIATRDRTQLYVAGPNDFDKPKNNPRRGPNCGAPTPTPVPLRISYSLSKILITSKRVVRLPAPSI